MRSFSHLHSNDKSKSFIPQKRAFITGAAGFVGAHLSGALYEF